MPKEQNHVADAQKQRKKIKEKFSKYVPAKVTLQVLGTGAEGAPRCLYVFSDQARYIFNCGEGTQRLAHEHKMKLAKLEHVFITQPIWKNMGGLPGTALTIQDVGVPQLTLHGPDGLSELFKATKRFVVMKNLRIETAVCEAGGSFSDNVMTVTYVPLERIREEVQPPTPVAIEWAYTDELEKASQAGSSTATIDCATSTRRSRKRRRSSSRNNSVSDDDTDYYAHESKISRSRSRNRSSTSRSPSASGSRNSTMSTITESTKCHLMEMKEQAVVMCYVCRLQPRPGALDLNKCVQMGVQPGPMLGQLKGGREVTLPDGKVVKPSDVCEPDDPGPVFIVVDCPSEEYLNSLILHDSIGKHQAQASKDEDLAYLVVHFTPMHILENPRYQLWMERFSPSTQHLLLNDANTCMGSISVHRIQQKLNLLSNDIFPLLQDTGTEVGETLTETPNKKIHRRFLATSHWDVIQPRTFCNFHLRPKKGFDNSGEIKLCPADYIKETMDIEGFPLTLLKLKNKLIEKRAQLTIRPYPQVLFLGTGSCIPNKTRNTSGILLETSDSSNILVDCGEGTYGQIVRFFGESSKQILANTDAVYISHLHADHHIGLVGFLQGRRKARQLLNLPAKPVYLLAPLQIISWLSFYDLCFENIASEFELVPNGDLLVDASSIRPEVKKDLLNTLNMSDISTCYVRHCPNAFGVTFTHKLGFKITYSGDSMPCDNLVKLGLDSDLLIHEATMEDELAHEAVIKMHSTTSQAIDIGNRMRAKYILLTHFSQRYAKLPRFNENFKDNIGIAFDNMRIKLDELPLVPLLYPALRSMFAEHYEELEQKSFKRQQRLERERAASIERKSALQSNVDLKVNKSTAPATTTKQAT